MAFLDLAECVGIIVGGDRYITAVEDSSPAVEGVCIESYIIATVKIETA